MTTRRTVLEAGAGLMLAAGTLSSVAAAQQEESASFLIAGLTGEQQVPAVETSAEGGALFALDEDRSQLHYTLAVTGVENTTMAHIHQGSTGEGGAVVTWLYPAPEVQSPRPLEGTFSGVLASDIVTEADLTGPLGGESLSALVDEMVAGDTYVNVHTEANPDGEIRGQVLPLAEIAGAVDQWQPADTQSTSTPTPSETETPTATLEDDPGY